MVLRHDEVRQERRMVQREIRFAFGAAIDYNQRHSSAYTGTMIFEPLLTEEVRSCPLTKFLNISVLKLAA